MSYKRALEAAGAKVLAFEIFGTYQGDWFAKVEFRGKTGWILGSFGSCSQCDAFCREFGYEGHEHEDGNYIGAHYECVLRDDCEECQKLKKKLAAFGTLYLEDLRTQEEAEEYAKKNITWDLEAEKALKFVKTNAES